MGRSRTVKWVELNKIWFIIILLLEPAHVSTHILKAPPPHFFCGSTRLDMRKGFHDLAFKCNRTFNCLKAKLRRYKYAPSHKWFIYRDVKGCWGRGYKLTDQGRSKYNINKHSGPEGRFLIAVCKGLNYVFIYFIFFKNHFYIVFFFICISSKILYQDVLNSEILTTAL